MNREPHTSGFERDLMTRMREKKSTNVQAFEHPSYEVACDAELLMRARERSNENLINTKVIQSQRLQFTATQKKNWSSSQNDKRNRTIRELQFQLANEKLTDLKKLKDNSIHRSSQIEGIAAFELCLIKNGLESEDDIGLSIGKSYENSEAFQRGIEERARKSFPDDIETSKFVTRLKARTKEIGAARLEKERRRRKVASDQSNVDMQIEKPIVPVEANSLVDNEDEDDSSGDENSVDLSSHQNNRKELAEESIRVFAEQSRMRYAESNGQDLLLNVLEAQRQRAKNKSSAASMMCREFVLSLLLKIDYGEEINSLSIRGLEVNDANNDSPMDLLNRIDSELRTNDCSNFCPSISFSEDLASHDCWLPYAVLTANIGRWSLISKPVDTAETNCASLADDIESEKGREPCAVMSKAPLFQESVQAVLEGFLEISCADSTDISLALNAEEQTDFREASEGIILVLGGGSGCDLCSVDLTRTIGWMGGARGIELWDVAAAIEAGRALAPLLEGKNPSVTYLALLDIFAFGSASALADASPRKSVWHEALKAVALTPRAMKILTDISDAATRISGGSKPHPLTSTGGKTDGKGEAAVPTAFFNNVTFGILLGQTLWLRGYLKKLYVDFVAGLDKKEEISEESGSSPVERNPFAPFVIVSRCIRADVSYAENDQVSFALAVEWFLRGGTKEGLYDTAVDNPGKKLLREAVTAECEAMTSGNGKGHEKAKSKGGGGGLEADLSGPSAIICIVRVTCQGQPVSHLHIPAALSGPPSKDCTDSGADRTRCTLSTATRQMVSNFSGRVIEAQRPVTASSVDLGSQELVLIETAAGASIPYIQLVRSAGTAEDTASTSSTVLSPNSILFAKGLSASETLLSIALACKTNHGYGQSGGDFKAEILKDTRSIRSKVLDVMAQRRKRLCIAEQLWLLHVSASNPLDLLSAFSALNRVKESRDLDIELTGACVMAYGMSLSSLEMEFRRKEADMIRSLKATDPRLRDICLRAQERMLPSPLVSQNRFKNTSTESNGSRVLSNEEANVVVSDCICMLGDVIDLRHIAWIELAASHRAALEGNLVSFAEVASSVSLLLADALSAVHSIKLKSGMLVADLFSAAHHTELPFELSYCGSRATRRAVDVRKDRLRSASLLLSASCASIFNSDDRGSDCGSQVHRDVVDQISSSSAAECDPWKDFILTDESSSRAEPPVGAISLHDSINEELRAEMFERAICLLSALTVGVAAMKEHLEEHNRSVEGMIVSRFRYEHLMLKQWTAKLQESLASSGSTGFTAESPLSLSPFNVYDSDGSDGIPCRAHSGAVELSDLTLPLHAVSELSVLMNGITKDSEDLSEESCHEMLRKCMGEMDPHSIPSAWQQDRKSRSLVNNVLQNCGLNSSSQDTHFHVTATTFVNAQVMTLLQAAIPSPPTASFILRLGEIFGGKRTSSEKGVTQLVFLPEKRPRLADFKEIVRGDKRLGLLWLESMRAQGDVHADGDMEHAIMAAASCSEDSQGLVIVERVMAMLCCSPPLIKSKAFRRALLLHALTDADNSVANAFDARGDAPSLLSLSSDGLCKALVCASRVVDSSASNCPSGNLTFSQYQWLLKCAPVGLPHVPARLFCPRFSLEESTHRECGDKSADIGEGSADAVVEGVESRRSSASLISRSRDARARIVLSEDRGQVARILDVAVEVFDSIIKSSASKMPFSV